MKKIAITQRLIENNNYFEIRDALDIKWAALFKKLDFLPIILPTYYDFESYFQYLEIDGIILSSGNNLSHFTYNKLSKDRDLFEKKLIKFAINNKIPLLGVCRGMQIIGDYFKCYLKKVEHAAITHKLIISRDSCYYNQLKNLDIVNSYHNYALDRVSNEILITAKSEGGIIEAIEHKNYKIFGQMWHTERESPSNKSELEFIRYFFEC